MENTPGVVIHQQCSINSNVSIVLAAAFFRLLHLFNVVHEHFVQITSNIICNYLKHNKDMRCDYPLALAKMVAMSQLN